MRFADEISTALQLTNFWQDVAADAARDHIYLPAEDLHFFGVTEADIKALKPTRAIRDLLRYEVARTRALYERGRPLLARLGNDLKLELALIWLIGTTILDKIEAADFDVFTQRPTITTRDKAKVLAKAAKHWATTSISRRCGACGRSRMRSAVAGWSCALALALSAQACDQQLKIIGPPWRADGGEVGYDARNRDPAPPIAPDRPDAPMFTPGGDGGARVDTGAPAAQSACPGGEDVATPTPCAAVGIVIDPAYAASYTCFDLGSVPGVPMQQVWRSHPHARDVQHHAAHRGRGEPAHRQALLDQGEAQPHRATSAASRAPPRWRPTRPTTTVASPSAPTACCSSPAGRPTSCNRPSRAVKWPTR